MQSFILEQILRISVMGAVLTCFIILYKVIAGKRLGARWHYLIWLLLLIRLAIPFSVESPVSIYNLPSYISSTAPAVNIAEYARTQIPQIDAVRENISRVNITVEQAEPVNTPAEAYTSLSHMTINIPFIVWLSGFIIMLSITVSSNFSLYLRLKTHSVVKGGQLTDILNDCGSMLGLKSLPLLIETRFVSTPALFGLFKLRLLVPEGCLKKIGADRVGFVFLHELAHLKRKDIIINVFSSILQAIHWFNPFIWYGFYRMRIDRETACDAFVLNYLPNDDRMDYGRTLISMLESFSKRNMPAALASFLHSKKDLKRRIALIASFKNSKYKWSVIPVMVLVIIAVLTLTNSVISDRQPLKEYIAGQAAHMKSLGFEFKNDERVLGRWEYADCVQDVDQFKPDKLHSPDTMLRDMIFIKDGVILSTYPKIGPALTPFYWTNGTVGWGNRNIFKYKTEVLGGKEFLFLELEVGDATNSRNPLFYVYRRINGKDYSNISISRKRDNTDFTFIYDSQMAGTWKCVDFVESISCFKPDIKSRKDGLMFREVILSEYGDVDATSNDGKRFSGAFRWTKGKILCPGQSLCENVEVKKLGGKSYMFMEFKNGDYIYRGAKPHYYVFEKV